MQSCANFVTPNTITVTYSGTITRHWSTGQSAVVVEYTYTVASDSAFVQRGNSCTANAPREFGCPTAQLTYDYKLHYYTPDVTPEDYQTGHVACGGCDANFECDVDIVYCRSRTDRYYGTTRTVSGAGTPFGSGCCQPRTSNSSVLRLICCNNCGCARPAVMYTPSVTLWFTAADFYTLTPLCCNPETPISSSGTWTLPQFQVMGACGCPTASTWNASNIVTDCASPDVAGDFISGQGSACGMLNCSGLPQGVTGSFKFNYAWNCYSDSGDPLNPIVHFCEQAVSAYDECAQTITVTIT
jgi:hypothetical protein